MNDGSSRMIESCREQAVKEGRARGVAGSREARNLGYSPAAAARPASSGNPYKAFTCTFTEFFDVLSFLLVFPDVSFLPRIY